MHSKGQHFIPLMLLDNKNIHDGKDRLSKLNEMAFQDLCADVYDEVVFNLFINPI